MDKQEELEGTLETLPAEGGETPENSTSFDSDDVESLKAELEKERKSKEQLYARLKKMESKIDNIKVVEPKNDEKDSEWKEKIEFLVKRRDFDADELEIVSAFAKGMGKSLEEAVKHPAVEAAINSLREKKAAEKASLASSSRSEGGEDTLLAKWKSGKLSEDEFRKNFRKIQEEFFRTNQKNYE